MAEEEVEKDEATLQKEKEEEERLIEEASKGVSIDDLELSDAKEVSQLVLWRKEEGRRRVEADLLLSISFPSSAPPDLSPTPSSSP